MKTLRKRILKYVPDGAKEYVKLISLRARFPSCNISSHLVMPSASLGACCTIARGVEIGPKVLIGDYSYVNAGSIIASGTIGKFCSVGYYVQVGLPSHPTRYLSTCPRTYGSENIFGRPAFWEDYQAPPNVGNDVWIGSNALILQGCTVGDGAVIAAGAVVTRDVEPYSVVAGVPAIALKMRFDDETIARLLGWRWWDLSLDELRSFAPLFEMGEEAVRNLDRFLR